jgi:hypothetical protein
VAGCLRAFLKKLIADCHPQQNKGLGGLTPLKNDVKKAANKNSGQKNSATGLPVAL